MIDKRTTHAGQARYEVRLRGIDGKERSRTFRTRREAESYERAQRTSMEHGLWVDPSGGKITLASWTAEWERTVVHLRASTRRIYDVNLRRHILPELGQVELAKLTPSVLRAWLSGLTVKAGAHGGILSPASVAQIYRTLNRVLVAAVDNELLGRNPLQGVKPPATPLKPMRFLTHDEVARLGEEIDHRYQGLLLVAAYCGLRAGELIALRRGNVDIDHRTITVVEQVQCLHGRFEVLPPKSAAGRRRCGNDADEQPRVQPGHSNLGPLTSPATTPGVLVAEAKVLSSDVNDAGATIAVIVTVDDVTKLVAAAAAGEVGVVFLGGGP